MTLFLTRMYRNNWLLVPQPLRPAIKKLVHAQLYKRLRRNYLSWRRLVISRYLLFRYGKLELADIRRLLNRHNICDGDILLFQCSWEHIFNPSFNAFEFTSFLIECISPNGTLVMPAYTNSPSSFCLAKSPTYTGLVPELFRRLPGTMRSLHPRHSVSVYGPLATYIVSGHEQCAYADGPDSPFHKLLKLPHSKALTIGLPPGYLSILHWVEDIEPDRFPVPIKEPHPIYHEIIYRGNLVCITDFPIKDEYSLRIDIQKISSRLSPRAMLVTRFHGIPFIFYDLPILSQELLRLRDKGIVHYK